MSKFDNFDFGLTQKAKVSEPAKNTKLDDLLSAKIMNALNQAS